MPGRQIRSVLVTGCNRGIGYELVQQFLKSSNPPEKIFATCRDPSAAPSQKLMSLTRNHPNLEIIQLEVTDLTSIKGAFKAVQEKLEGRSLNMLINNAGVLTHESVETSSEEDMMRVYNTNVIAPMLLTREFLPLLKKTAQEKSTERMSCRSACVINMTSILGSVQDVPNPVMFSAFKAIAYRCSKSALNMLTRCQAETYKNDGIIFIAVHPGWVQTDMGGSQAPMTLEQSVGSMMNLFAKLSAEQNGHYVDWKGDTIPY
ncbi:C-signal-like [Ascaphus truei]|uniref:C-signal-like n=1 Tax=Ascaphus truei TaxID=8439 RepID=UPI003F5AB609